MPNQSCAQSPWWKAESAWASGVSWDSSCFERNWNCDYEGRVENPHLNCEVIRDNLIIFQKESWGNAAKDRWGKKS